MGLHPLSEWVIHVNEDIIVSMLIPCKISHHIDTPANEWCTALIHPVELFPWQHRQLIPLAAQAKLDAIVHV